MILFGGESGGVRLNDTWILEFTPVLQWVRVESAGELPPVRARHQAIFDPIRNRLIVIGGWTEEGVSPDTWALSLVGTPRWTRLLYGPPRYDHNATYDAEHDRAIVFGGQYSSQQYQDTYYLSLGNPDQWWLLTQDGPACCVGTSCIYDPIRGRMVEFGGFCSGWGFMPCIHALDLRGQPIWTDLQPEGGAFPERAYHSAVYDSRQGRMVVFGGWNSRDDTWLLTWGTQPPFEIVSATTDRELYQNGVESAQVTVTTRSNWGQSGAMTLSVDIEPSLGNVMHVGADVFPLAPGEDHVSHFSWAVPDSSYAWELDGRLLFADQQMRGFSALRRIGGWFRGNPIAPLVVFAYQDQVQMCWTPEEECKARLVSIIPVAGSLASLELAANDLCTAAVFRNRGDFGRSYGAFHSAIDKLGKQLILETVSVLAVGTPVGIPVATARLLHSTGEYARHCMNGGLASWLSWIPLTGRPISSGSAVDSLATWMQAGVDSTQADLADVALFGGRFNVKVSADGGYAVTDSSGLAFASVDEVDTLAVIASTTRHVHEIHGVDDDNPHSAASFSGRALAAQAVAVGALHRRQDGSWIYLRYPECPVPVGAVLRLDLADDVEEFPLLIDDDGNGTIDRTIYPVPAAVDGGRQGIGIAEILGSRPNPFYPRTVIRFAVMEPDRVVLRVYDTAGRPVTTLFDQHVPAGVYEVPWNGQDSEGRQTPSGVYFYQLQASKARMTERLIVLH
ncbi:MAG: FlgD immunoglobulin-like domain containing protein [Kiritimatiellae bacterium]|nr:FlgD immunoglobulin-like domain containing protein [Kiritimatiellia bacterium]